MAGRGVGNQIAVAALQAGPGQPAERPSVVRVAFQRSLIAVARVVEWVSQGFSPAWIASVIGTSRATVPEIAVAAAGGRPYRMTWAVSRAILRADITAATEGWRDATGTRRRLQALAWLGYPQSLIADMTGLPPATVAIIARGQQRHVTPQQWRSISAAYEQVGDLRGPSTAAHSRAVTRGWLPPATWDDPDTDAHPMRAAS